LEVPKLKISISKSPILSTRNVH